MRMKLIVALVGADKTETVIAAARAGGATGATVLGSARGEGLRPAKTFLGLDFSAAEDAVLFLVVEPRARDILERIQDVAGFKDEPGAGIAFQLAIEDVVGLDSQLPAMREELEPTL